MLRSLLNALSVVALIALLAGLAARGRWRASTSFSGYVLAVLVPDALTLLWPERFLVWEFWLFKEAVHGVLKFAIALEIAGRTFAAFPGARYVARRVLLLVLVLAWAAIVSLPVDPTSGRAVLGGVLPRILNGTIWVFVAVAALVLWYRLPVTPLDKGLMLGFVPYLLVFTVTQSLLPVLGWGADLARWLGHVQSTAFLLLALYWNSMVWSARGADDLGQARIPALEPVRP